MEARTTRWRALGALMAATAALAGCAAPKPPPVVHVPPPPSVPIPLYPANAQPVSLARLEPVAACLPSRPVAGNGLSGTSVIVVRVEADGRVGAAEVLWPASRQAMPVWFSRCRTTMPAKSG